MPHDGPRVLIIGAGIGGLSTALSLHAAGAAGSIRVVDSSRQLRPLGAGINLQPHAVRELTELGLGEQLADVSAEPRQMLFTDRHGNRIVAHARGREAGYTWPQASVHRGDLQRLLLTAVHERLGAASVRTGLQLESFREGAEGVTARLRERTGKGDGSVSAADVGRDAAEVTIEADVLIGADGLYSAVRGQLHPSEGQPRWNGIRMWRGVTDAPAPLDGRTMLVAGSYRPARIVVYPLGQGRVNWVAEVRESQPTELSGADWAHEGRLADVLPYFRDWRLGLDGLDVPGLLREAPHILEYPMVDRDPLDRWGRGRVTLLGDAAHPMLPVGSNGGSQAVLDARVLARELARSPGDPMAGLRAYETARREPANAIASACRDMAADRVLDTIAERAPRGFERIGNVLTSEELALLRENMRRTTDQDVAELNSRPSWSVRPG